MLQVTGSLIVSPRASTSAEKISLTGPVAPEPMYSRVSSSARSSRYAAFGPNSPRGNISMSSPAPIWKLAMRGCWMAS